MRAVRVCATIAADGVDADAVFGPSSTPSTEYDKKSNFVVRRSARAVVAMRCGGGMRRALCYAYDRSN